jgi:hypothetical protein
MNPLIRQLAVAGLLLLGAGAASAAVTVSYDHPERFTDMPFSTWERDDVLKDLAGHFERLGKVLPQGQDLHIDVLDIDLAGRASPGYRGRDLRVMRGQADWPRIHLRYSLESNGAVLKQGDVQLSDLGYLDRLHNVADDTQSLRYEKRMIDDWFDKTIGPRRTADR